jgi:hypothetical protein
MTVTTPLTCDGFASALADYLERDDTPRMRAAVEMHAARCAACGTLLADLQELRLDASGLPTLTPERDLWEGIAKRIEAPVVELGAVRGARSGVGGAPYRERAVRWLRPVAAAAALVVITAGITYLATREALLPETLVAGPPVDSTTLGPRTVIDRAIDSVRRAESVGTRVAASGPDERPPQAGAARRGVGSDRAAAVLVGDEPPVAAVETVYGQEIVRLRRIIDQRRALLDTATIGVIERNLTIIDRAIRESRAALARDPASALLNEQLNNALEQKVELLRAAALLPVRS